MKLNMNGLADINVTSLMGEIEISFSKLVDIFGKPNVQGDEYKVDAEWCGDIDGEVFTIYNYKTGENYLGEKGLPVEQITDWHIGGKSKEVAQKVIDYISSFDKTVSNQIAELQEKLSNSDEWNTKRQLKINELEDKLHRRNLQIADLKKSIDEHRKYKPNLMKLLEEIRDSKGRLAECEKEVIDEINSFNQ